jgi:hypothetical protein
MTKKQEVEQFINRFLRAGNQGQRGQSRIKALARHETLGKLEEIKTLDFKFRSRRLRRNG